MEKDKFNKIEFLRANSLQRFYPLDAIKALSDYVDKYPYDYNAYPYYINALITGGYAKEASKLIDLVIAITNGDNAFKSNNDRYNIFQLNILFVKIKLLAYLEEYKELRKIYLDNYDVIKQSKMNLGHINYYSKKKIGIPVKAYEDRPKAYMYRQMTEYNYDLFLEHIKKHLADDNMNLDKPNGNIFAATFPLLKVIDEMRKYIPSENGLFTGFLEEQYIFKYDNCGRDSNRIVDSIKVVCFHNTSDFITMCPVYGYEGFPYVDLNYMKEFNEKIKVRSGLDRFNQRYSK